MRRFIAMLLVCLLLPACAAAEYDFSDVFNQPAVMDRMFVESKWEHILLLGGDSRDAGAFGRTDTMMILSIDRDNAMVKMTSIMRDTWVEIPGNGKNKINAANVFGGAELAVETVNQNFGTDISDYVMVNMDDMASIIDLLGGVEIEITEAEAEQIGLAGAGLVTLNGADAVSYSRIRKIDSDYRRVMRQQKVLLAMARSAQDMEVDELMQAASDVHEIIETSLDKGELESLATAFMVMEVEDVEQFRLPADGAYEDGTFDGVWMIRPDIAKNKALLEQFIYGD